MRFAPVAAAPPERRRVTVAELLGQDLPPARSPARHRGPARPAVPTWESTLTCVAVPPPGWPGSSGARLRGLSVTAGALLTTGVIIAAAALSGQPERGPMSAGAADGGFPGAPRATTAPRPPAPALAPPRRAVATTVAAARGRQTPASRRVVGERPARHTRAPAVTTARTGRDADTPAGSALSRLTPAISATEALVRPVL
ncbi:MAG: hypothetical protein ACT4O0_01120 [Pseudonocardia sp.]